MKMSIIDLLSSMKHSILCKNVDRSDRLKKMRFMMQLFSKYIQQKIIEKSPQIRWIFHLNIKSSSCNSDKCLFWIIERVFYIHFGEKILLFCMVPWDYLVLNLFRFYRVLLCSVFHLEIVCSNRFYDPTVLFPLMYDQTKFGGCKLFALVTLKMHLFHVLPQYALPVRGKITHVTIFHNTLSSLRTGGYIFFKTL